MPAMKDKIFAVIDTNVIVSALLSSRVNSFFLLRTANESFIKMAGTCRNIKGTSPVLDCGARLHRWDGWAFRK